MRKTTEVVVGAFLAGKARKMGNTSTDGTILRLHGNRIAERMPDGSIVATLAGWGTVTTRERLNGLCRLLDLPCMFGQEQFCQFYGTRPIGVCEEVVLVRPEGKPVTVG
jgi:hypothetical protein